MRSEGRVTAWPDLLHSPVATISSLALRTRPTRQHRPTTACTKGGTTHTTQVLKELGYHYIESSHALGALPHLQSEQPIDLLVTDVGLPNMNGRQLAEIARELRQDLRILFMTGYAEKSVARNRFLAPECS
jgi:DNA-binding LytR/AlgR family response regulator